MTPTKTDCVRRVFYQHVDKNYRSGLILEAKVTGSDRDFVNEVLLRVR